MTQETLFFSGDDYFKSLFESIELAKKSIYLETYIYDEDKVGLKIAHSLINAHKRGVIVKVMIDGMGSIQWGGKVKNLFDENNIEYKIYHPAPWKIAHIFNKQRTKFIFRKWIKLFSYINKRNHRKTILVDEKLAYFGSFNISKKHLSKESFGENWRDTGVRVESEEVLLIKKAFDWAWSRGIRNLFSKINKNSFILLNDTRRKRKFFQKLLFKKLKLAQNKIWITNAYFIPSLKFISILSRLAKRKLDVRIILPQKSDVAFMNWATQTFYADLIKIGIRIFEYKPSMLHAKSIIIDDWKLVGSSNLNTRSRIHDLEIDYIIQNEDNKKKLEIFFKKDMENSVEIVHSDYVIRSKFKRIIGRFILLFRYWL